MLQKVSNITTANMASAKHQQICCCLKSNYNCKAKLKRVHCSNSRIAYRTKYMAE